MRPALRTSLAFMVVVVTVWLQISFIGVWPILGTIVNIVLVAILGVALFWSWNHAVWLALVAGWIMGQYAVWTPTYPIALIGMVYGTRLVVRRWMTTRSSASLVVAAATATGIYYGLVAVCITVAQHVNRSTIGPDWGPLWPMVMCQTIVHPILLYFFWRRASGGTYARAATAQPF